ncbi:uncharacterized protein F5147DRAFT_701197 [Suillus discolor]|uniref:Uncharacterized protein n=1 Tax=Suillus discolor TaxID=1912936 RepID=A0A9P7JSS8_9AGAM|nr:uncharacterized protein F5147DRAFT_701197 [Suillus discolor]KAG2106150.1 hypothetical protein F5147DRAFT_701197 [Suillus discolor]
MSLAYILAYSLVPLSPLMHLYSPVTNTSKFVLAMPFFEGRLDSYCYLSVPIKAYHGLRVQLRWGLVGGGASY